MAKKKFYSTIVEYTVKPKAKNPTQADIDCVEMIKAVLEVTLKRDIDNHLAYILAKSKEVLSEKPKRKNKAKAAR